MRMLFDLTFNGLISSISTLCNLMVTFIFEFLPIYFPLINEVALESSLHP